MLSFVGQQVHSRRNSDKLPINTICRQVSVILNVFNCPFIWCGETHKLQNGEVLMLWLCTSHDRRHIICFNSLLPSYTNSQNVSYSTSYEVFNCHHFGTTPLSLLNTTCCYLDHEEHMPLEYQNTVILKRYIWKLLKQNSAVLRRSKCVRTELQIQQHFSLSVYRHTSEKHSTVANPDMACMINAAFNQPTLWAVVKSNCKYDIQI